jgi:hypothetical protein
METLVVLEEKAVVGSEFMPVYSQIMEQFMQMDLRPLMVQQEVQEVGQRLRVENLM